VAFDERSLNMMLGSYTGSTVAAKIIKPTWHLLSLKEREFLVSMDGTEAAASAREPFSSADPPRNDTYASLKNAGRNK